MHFRKDINGLRALAVLAVVLFHFNFTWMPGGFAGVDVFFVISGFLMTGIIFRGIAQNNFSILTFYIARANRIIPALTVLCLALMLLGWFYLSPLDYRALGKHAASSVSFLSNAIYWKEAGYFDTASHGKWLLHTWSLSAELQFYIIYPAILVALKKFLSLNALKKTVLLGTLIGFTFCVIATDKWPDSSYYLLHTRAWEMMLGGLAYLFPLNLNQAGKKLAEWLGLALIIGSYLFITEADPWPSHFALFPVLGTFLIIQAQRSDSFFTTNTIAQKIGTWSYSIYLWHWPIAVAIYYFSLHDAFRYLGIALSIFLGFLSHRYIEKAQFRNDFSNLFSYSKCKPILMVLIVSFIGGITYHYDGFFIRFDNIDNIKSLAKNRALAELYYRNNLVGGDPHENSLVCTLDGGKQTTSTAIDCLQNKLGNSGYLVIGDSHGRDLFHALMRAYPNTNFAMLHQSSCVPTNYINKAGRKDHCFSILNGHFKITSTLRGIIFASAYGDDGGIGSLIRNIEDNVYGPVPMFLVNSGPRLDQSVVELAIKDAKVKDYYKLGLANQKVLEVNDKLRNAKVDRVFDKYAVFCTSDSCNINNELEPLIWDAGHLSDLGIEKLSNAIGNSNFLNLESVR